MERKEIINISLTEFMNFVNKSGTAKTTVVSNSKSKRDDEYEHYKDYWLKLRDKIKSVHKGKKGHEDLKTLIEEIHIDKKENYQNAILGYLKFWKKRKLEWVNPPKKTWIIGDMNIDLNPELGLVINDKVYVIKLFTSANTDINKMHASLILNLMEKELRDTVEGDEVVFAVLDVKRGKLFENNTKDISQFPLLMGEAKSFETIWKSI